MARVDFYYGTRKTRNPYEPSAGPQGASPEPPFGNFWFRINGHRWDYLCNQRHIDVRVEGSQNYLRWWWVVIYDFQTRVASSVVVRYE